MVNYALSALILLLVTVSCGSMRKSGQYVYIENASEAPKVARRYGVTVDQLKGANPGKRFHKEWLFVPSKVGIAYILNDTYVVEDYGSLGSGRFMWPVPNFYKVSSHYGPRGGRHHDGIDIPAPRGTPIVASDSGEVIYSDNGIRGYGNMVVIHHGDDVFTVYAHCKKNKVSKGDKVRRGETIALVGNTGRSSGPHLHFEIRLKNTKTDPGRYLSQAKE